MVEYLDIATWEWTRIANLNNGRNGHQMGFIGDKLTLFGGSDSAYDYQDSVEQYDATENVWEVVEPMKTARYTMGMAGEAC